MSEKLVGNQKKKQPDLKKQEIDEQLKQEQDIDESNLDADEIPGDDGNDELDGEYFAGLYPDWI